jgi:hypothetical protein
LGEAKKNQEGTNLKSALEIPWLRQGAGRFFDPAHGTPDTLCSHGSGLSKLRPRILFRLSPRDAPSERHRARASSEEGLALGPLQQFGAPAETEGEKAASEAEAVAKIFFAAPLETVLPPSNSMHVTLRRGAECQ